MPGVTYSLADFRTGGPILDLPVMEGAKWAAQLNRADTLSCTVDMRSAETLSLDLRAASEPKKTVLFARTDADVVLAWGLVDDDREWDEDARTLSLSGKGVWTSYFGKALIGPASALTAPLVVGGVENAALNTLLSGYALGGLGVKLVEQRLTWPGSPTFILPAAEVGPYTEAYAFASLKTVGSALLDITNRENGVDFALDARRASNGLNLEYVMRAGTAAAPGVGRDAGGWALGNDSPVTGLVVSDSATDVATAAWLVGGRSSGSFVMSRALNAAMITSDGYAPLDYVDTSRGTVTVQETLDGYARAAAAYARGANRSVSFSVRGDTSPLLGSYRPGDTMTLSPPDNHPWLTADLKVRVTSISGDETGDVVKIGCITI